ncbi:MAG: CBS domain-containing protein [Nitrosopumilus sp.]|nr:CBS domain-containing protein [Nitrosopumilus sp.]MBT3685994.1 CBS domain-containing protein [Nitrosopumilus sp.]MBT4550639.1 CBS domain-containing protein [Nitrosopumilus sp.]
MQFNPYVKTKKIKDVMKSTILALESSATASDAAKIMEIRDIEAIVVVENKKFIGIVTDRDFTIKLGSHAYPIDTPINRLMSYPLISIDQNAEISVAQNLMKKNKVKRLPVISENALLGMVTMNDIHI